MTLAPKTGMSVTGPHVQKTDGSLFAPDVPRGLLG